MMFPPGMMPGMMPGVMQGGMPPGGMMGMMGGMGMMGRGPYDAYMDGSYRDMLNPFAHLRSGNV